MNVHFCSFIFFLSIIHNWIDKYRQQAHVFFFFFTVEAGESYNMQTSMYLMYVFIYSVLINWMYDYQVNDLIPGWLAILSGSKSKKIFVCIFCNNISEMMQHDSWTLLY